MSLELLQDSEQGMNGQLKSWWGKLTNNDLKAIEARHEQLVEILQERYGWSKTHAKKEINTQLEHYKNDQSQEDNMGQQSKSNKQNTQFSTSRQGARAANDSQFDDNQDDHQVDDRNQSAQWQQHNEAQEDEFDAQPSYQQYEGNNFNQNQQRGRDRNLGNNYPQQNRGFSQDSRGSNQHQGQGNYCSQCGTYIGQNSNQNANNSGNGSNQGRQNNAYGSNAIKSSQSSRNRNQNMNTTNNEHDDEDNGQYATQQSGLQKQNAGLNANQKNKQQTSKTSVRPSSKAKR